MKNIHVLPTDKPSELYINMQGVLSKSNSLLLRLKSRNIYITSDEEIKKGDGKYPVLGCKGTVYKDCPETWKESGDWKKIILTTDQDLIKDGVQAIDDEFLEWFVNNPSCKFVEIRYNVGTYNPHYLKFYEVSPPKSYYKIIIPKEETLTITLNKEEVRGLLNCIMRTSAKGKDLDVGEMVEDKLVEFLNLK